MYGGAQCENKKHVDEMRLVKVFIILGYVLHISSLKYTSIPHRGRRLSSLLARDSTSDSEGPGSSIDSFMSQTSIRPLIEQLEIKRPYLDILLERASQTVDDWQLSSKIKAYAKIVDSNPSKRTNILESSPRERIVILGTGWASYSLCKSLDSTIYDVVVVSPRNYFLFTPMLAASAVGTVEFKSICDPIRNINPFVDYLEATAERVDVASNSVTCTASVCEGTSCSIHEFEVKYDYLVVAVGASTNTFGIKVTMSLSLYLTYTFMYTYIVVNMTILI
jgi:Pyridine nucleotide-disulphide oxidoreductase